MPFRTAFSRFHPFSEKLKNKSLLIRRFSGIGEKEAWESFRIPLYHTVHLIEIEKAIRM
ncbi:hypothetical protein [Alistipes dispar]|uniref:hypothetical protein n=1 Tax=Alistipes dispar TaxID=2585119 RepID=UPI003AB292C7